MDVTVDECKQAVRNGNIKRSYHHRCCVCGYMTGYVFDTAKNVLIDPSREGLAADDLVVGFDRGCDCSRYGITLTTWEEFSHSFNMQSTPERRREMFDRFVAGKPTHE